MSLSEARERLAARQLELVQALVGGGGGGGAVPAGFDEQRIRQAARSLVNKRLREVALAWPELTGCLGDRFPAEQLRVSGVFPDSSDAA